MIRLDQIPPEVVEALQSALLRSDLHLNECIAAALNAWPGVWLYRYHDNGERAIILPITEGDEQ